MRLGKRLFVIFPTFVILLSLSSCTFVTKLKARDRLNKGVREYTAKNFDKAEEFFKESIQLDPTLLNGYLYLATTYSAMYQPGLATDKNNRFAQKAIETFQEVLSKADPNDKTSKSISIANIAGIYDNLEEFDKAKEWSRKLLELDPDNAEAYYRIGVIDWKISFKATGHTGENVNGLSTQEKERVLKTIDEGIAALDKALEKKPEYGDAIEYVNLLYREKAKFSKDEKERAELIKKADRYAYDALKLKKKQKEEEIKKGKKKI